MFRSKSSLKKKAVRDLRINVEPATSNTSSASTNHQQLSLSNLRHKVDAAQAALDALNALVSTLETAADEATDNEIAASADVGVSSSTAVSIDIHISDLHSSAKAITAILSKHAPVVNSPTTHESDLYPAPLRVPVCKIPSPVTAFPAHIHQQQELRSFQEWELAQGQHRYSTGPLLQYTTPQQHAVARPVSLPPSVRNHELARRDSSASFSTEAKTRRLRSIHGSMASLSEEFEGERQLGMDELMSFLRAGNSIRDL